MTSSIVRHRSPAALALLAFLLFAVAPAAWADLILQAFNWRYTDVEARAAQIQSAGYRMVPVSPAYRSDGGEWWARYQPQDLRLIDNPLGQQQADAMAFTRLQGPQADGPAAPRMA